MESVIVRERYKVIQVLEAEDSYAFAEAVDITERETPTRLLNIYEGKWLSTYARVFSKPIGGTDFCDAFPLGDSLVAVFRPHDGEPIDHMFYRGAKWSWEDRLHYAEEFLHSALGLADLPYEMSCAALFSDNVLIDADKGRVSLRFRVRPLEGMNARELALLASDHVRKIFAPRFWQTDAEYDFCQRLKRGEFPSIVKLYAAWRRAEETIRQECEKIYEKNTLQVWWIFLRKKIKRLLKRRQG